MLLKIVRLQKFKTLKRITYRSRSKLLLQSKKSEGNFTKLLYLFYDATKINGFYYLRRGKTSGKARLFWMLVPIVMLILTGILIHLLAQVYQENSTFISMDSPKFACQTEFPSISICANEPLLWFKIKKLLDQSKIPANSTLNDTTLAIQSLNGFIRLTYVTTVEHVHALDEFLTLNNLTVPQLIATIDMDCHDFITKFRFADNIIECNADNCPGWKKVATILGTCCAFNYYPSARKNATALNQFGKLSGLNILFSNQIPNSGLSLVFSQPGGFVTHYDDLFALIPGSDNYFRIDVQSDALTPYFRRLSETLSKCLPPDGPSIMTYRSQCVFVCTLEIIYRKCGCHPHHMPILTQKSASMRNCTAKDILCFRNKTDIWNAQCLHCLPPCTRLVLHISNTIGSSDKSSSISTLNIYKNISADEKPLTAFIFYGRQTMTILKRHAQYHWTVLIANLGGVLNLTLGFSLLSICELLYYFVYKLIILNSKSQ